MSYSLTPYAVDLAKITTVLGSKDESLFGLLSKQFEDEFDNIDAIGGECLDDNEDSEERGGEDRGSKPSSQEDLLEMVRCLLDQDSAKQTAQCGEKADAERDTKRNRLPCPSTAEALRHLIMGEECDRRVAFKYGYVLESLCRHFGEVLPHDNWCDLRSGQGWFQELDDTLRLAGVPTEVFSISGRLVERGSPIPIPKIRDFPFIGYLLVAEIEQLLEALGKARIDDIGEEEEEEEEPWLPEGLNDVRCWLRTCAESRRDLACFYF